MDLNPDEPYPSSERERKFPRCLFTSSIKRDIRHFQVVVLRAVPTTGVQKIVLHVQSCCFATYSFFGCSRDRRRHRFLRTV